jgi:hypothetical protein
VLTKTSRENKNVKYNIYQIVHGTKGHMAVYVTYLSINCHLARSAMNYLLYYTQYMQICQTKCFYYYISKTKNEFEQNPEENIILIGPGQYYTIIVFCWGQCELLWTLETIFTEAFRLRWILISKVHKHSYWPIQKTVIVLLH